MHPLENAAKEPASSSPGATRGERALGDARMAKGVPRAGTKGSISQGARAFGLRRARSTGFTKTAL